MRSTEAQGETLALDDDVGVCSVARRIGDLPNIAELEMLRRIGDATDAAKIVTLLFLRVGESWTVVQVRYRADPVLAARTVAS